MNRRLLFRLFAAAPVAAVLTAAAEAELRKRNELLDADHWNWHLQQAQGGAVQPEPEKFLPEGFDRFGVMTAEQYIAMRRRAA